METSGEYLRKRREESGKSLEEISRRVNVRPEVLRNLEADLFGFAQAEVYIVGTLTAYARALGLDPAEVLERYHAMSAPRARDVPKEPQPEEGSRVGRRGILIVAAVLAAVAVVAVVMGRQGSTERPVARPPSRAVTVPTVTPSEPRAASRPATEPQPVRVVLELSVRESTWVGLTIDGSRRYSALLPPGEWRRWEADSVFAVTIGNAAGAILTLDGEPVDLPREHGRVVVLELPEREDRDRRDGGHARPPHDDQEGGPDL